MNNWMEKLLDKFLELVAKSSLVRNVALILATCLAVEACATPLFTSHIVALAETVTETVAENASEVFGTAEELSNTEGEPENETDNESEGETASLSESQSSDEVENQSETTQEESEYEEAIKEEVIENDYASGSEDTETDGELLMMPMMALLGEENNDTVTVIRLYKRENTDGSGTYESSPFHTDTVQVTRSDEAQDIYPDNEYLKSADGLSNLRGFKRDIGPVQAVCDQDETEVEFHFDSRLLTVKYEKGIEDAPDAPAGSTVYFGRTFTVSEYGSTFSGYTFSGYKGKYDNFARIYDLTPNQSLTWNEDNDDALTYE